MSDFEVIAREMPDQETKIVNDADPATVESAISLHHESLGMQNQAEQTAESYELPESHANIDVENLTINGTIAACKFLADVARTNPTLAQNMVKNTINSKKQELEMRQNGMDEKAIKSQKWAEMRKKQNEKVKHNKSELKKDKQEKSHIDAIKSVDAREQNDEVENSEIKPVQTETMHRIDNENEQIYRDKLEQLLKLGKKPEKPIPNDAMVATILAFETSKNLEQKTDLPIIENVEKVKIEFAGIQASTERQFIIEAELSIKTASYETESTQLPNTEVQATLSHIEEAEILRQSSEFDIDSQNLQTSIDGDEIDNRETSTGKIEVVPENDKDPITQNVFETFDDSEAMVIGLYEDLVSIILEKSQSGDLIEYVSDEVTNVTNSEQNNQRFQSFEGYIATQPKAENPPSFTEIKLHVDEAPLEQTILQVSNLITLETITPEIAEELAMILDELQEIIVLATDHNEEYPILTLEITAKLIQLIGVLGYEKPDKVLLEYVSAHGYAFLWQSIEHIIESEKRVELGVANQLLIATANNEDVMSKIVKYIFGLVGAISAEPLVTS